MENLDKIKVNQYFLSFYKEQLEVFPKVKQYVLSRISQETITEWNIGYAPYALPHIDISNDDLEDMSFTTNGIPFFQNRIMIPIYHAGMIVGFTGRIFGESKTKYKHSRNSEIFNKSSILFGLDHARQYIMEKGHVILVEGQFDVLGLWDQGIYNVIALGGTSISKYGILLLKRYTKNVIVCLDADNAGIRSTEKIVATLHKSNFKICTITLPSGDPDEYVKANGVDTFYSLAKRREKNG